MCAWSQKTPRLRPEFVTAPQRKTANAVTEAALPNLGAPLLALDMHMNVEIAESSRGAGASIHPNQGRGDAFQE